MNRELWLNEAKIEIQNLYFQRNRRKLPPRIQIAVGWCKGKRAIGQCWDHKCTKGGTYQIFICPTQSDPIEILGILLHELIHACVGLKEKHGGRFASVARAVGLKGQLTCTTVGQGTELHQNLRAITEKLGEYPHDPITLEPRAAKSYPAKLALVSPTEPEYKLTISESVYRTHGCPYDPWGNEMHLITPK